MTVGAQAGQAVEAVYIRIGRKLRRRRKAKGWSQGDMADRMEMDRSSIANIEAGRQRTSLHLLYRFAHTLHVSRASLLR